VCVWVIPTKSFLGRARHFAIDSTGWMGSEGKKGTTERNLVLAHIVNLATRPPPARHSIASRGHRRRGPWWKRERTRTVDHHAGKNTVLFGSRSNFPYKQRSTGQTELKQEHHITTVNDTRMIAVAARRQQEHKSDTPPQGSSQ